MTHDRDLAAVVLAAGQGKRMAADLNKELERIGKALKPKRTTEPEETAESASEQPADQTSDSAADTAPQNG